MIPKCIKIPCGAAKGIKRNDREPKGSRKGPKWEPKATKMETRCCQNETRHLPKHPLRNRSEKVRNSMPKGATSLHLSGRVLVQNLWKTLSKIYSKINHENVWTNMLKGSRNGCQIDAKTHQTTMHKVITKKGVPIMNNVFFCKGRNLILSVEHRTVVQKQGPRGLAAKRCLYEKWR